MTISKITRLSLLLTLAIILQILEFMLPVIIPIPGVKLGLANIIALICIYKFQWKDVFFINIMRVILVSVVRGFFLSPTFFISLSGVIIASIVLILIYASKQFSIYGISLGSALGHVSGQMLMVVLLYQTWGMMIYLPTLLFLSALTSLVSAFLAKKVLGII